MKPLQRLGLTARQIIAILEIARTGQPLKKLEHGVYRSLRIKGLITLAKNGYALTEMGGDMVKEMARRQMTVSKGLSRDVQ